jgi:hypothetical protein
MPALRHSLVAAFFQNYSTGKSYTAAAAKRLLTPQTDAQRQKNTGVQVFEQRTDGDMVTLITTVHRIMTGLDSRHCRGHVCSHYESSVWTAYAKERITVSSVRWCSTVSTPILF